MQAIKIEARCPAKVNLSFDIKGVLENGYHEVETVLQAVGLYDRLVFNFQPSKPFAVRINNAGPLLQDFPLTQDNIICKAVYAFCSRRAAPADFDLEVTAYKNIPAGAGLGGASSNAAAVLLVLNAIFGNSFSIEDLTAMAAALGADVPFFLNGGLCLGTAFGDKLKPLNQLPLWFVLAKPREISVQSKWAYARFDDYVQIHGTAKLPRPDWRAVTGSLQPGKLGNVFEPVIFECYPALAKLKSLIESAGAVCCHMTGSGSALYGLATTEEQARRIARELSLDKRAANADVFVAASISNGVELVYVNENQVKASSR